MNTDAADADVIPVAPAVSVVIAAFNGAGVIGEQLRALQGEFVAGGFEVIVADNGSTDSTVNVVEQFAGVLDLSVVDASARRGQAFARNRGAAEARGLALLILDQDDVIAPGYVATMAAALDVHPLVAAGMNTARLNPGWVARARSVSQTDGLPTDFGVHWGYACTLGMRREVFESVGGFDESVRPAGEDVELCMRLAAAGYDMQFIPSATVQYRFPNTLKGLRHQGRAYGLGHISVCVRQHKQIHIVEVLGWMKSGFAAATWMLPVWPMERRGQGAFAFGRRLGLIEGYLRNRRTARRR